MDERRRYPRVSATVPVEYRVGSFGELIRDESLDISHGGFFLRTARAHLLGDVVSFRIITESEGGVIEGVASVVRVVDQGPEQARGLGLEFTILEEPSRSMMHKLVELHARAKSKGD
jgi:c-di-GMP-binding flagellar brake protein YcgR